jgi:hypothetical protein
MHFTTEIPQMRYSCLLIVVPHERDESNLGSPRQVLQQVVRANLRTGIQRIRQHLGQEQHTLFALEGA